MKSKTVLCLFFAFGFFAFEVEAAEPETTLRAPMYTIENEFLRVTISSLGAEMQSIYDRKNNQELLWQGDPRFWSARSPVLFPIVGRVQDGKYVYRDKTYSIDSPHGFAQRARFDVRDRQPDRLTLAIETTPETLRQYPFSFRLLIEHALEGSSLTVRFRVENNGDDPLPFSLGAHPGFRVPIEETEKFEDYRLEFADEQQLQRVLLDGVFISGKRGSFPLKDGKIISLQRRLFDDEAVILDSFQKRTISLIDSGNRKRWSLHFDDFRYLGLWQPERSEAPFVSLEPWDGLPDLNTGKPGDLLQKPDIKLVPPKEATELKYVFEVHSLP